MAADFDLDRHTPRLSLVFRRTFVYHLIAGTLVLNIQGYVQITRPTATVSGFKGVAAVVA